MAARVADDSFVPFVPRQHPRVSDGPQIRDQNHAALANDEVVQATNVEMKTETESEAEARADTEPPMVQATPVDVPTEVNEPSAAHDRSDRDVAASRGAGTGCRHAFEIRREAIRLAAIACGRALRHAALLHPAVIVAFVDDAIAAAGLPQHVRIRVHPGSIAHITKSHHDRISDDSLSPGDVIVESNDVTLGAKTDTRAGLLVRAAAEA